MLRKAAFLFVVFVTNVIQGITGFAGTALATPLGVMLVGFETAKPILNVLGILAGLYVVVTSYGYIDKREFLRTISVMIFGIAGGIILKSFFTDSPSILYKILGCIVMAVGVSGAYKTFFKKEKSEKRPNKILSFFILLTSGIVHGMFVCGGPLLVGYLSGRLKDKRVFRSTISAVWVVLNTIILFDDIRAGYFNSDLMFLLAISSVVLFLAMAVGSALCKRMSGELFMKITYFLLTVSGALLLIK